MSTGFSSPLGDAALVDALKTVLAREDLLLSPEEKVADIAAIQKATQAEPGSKPHAQYSRARGFSSGKGTLREGILRHPLLVATAVVATAIVAAVVAVSFERGRPFGTPPISTQPPRTYTTRARQLTTIPLSGGALAQLGPLTTLTVTPDAAGGGVIATVVGEAYFAVPNSQRTFFAVRVGNALTRVLGTTFAVRRYPIDSVTNVVVMDGRVSLVSVHHPTPRNPSAILASGSLGVVNDSGQVRVTPNIAIEDYTAWTTGTLVFRESRVRDIVADLARVYGADIRLADSMLATRVLTWTVPFSKKSLAGALDALTTVLDAHVTYSGSVITIAPGMTADHKPANPHISSQSERSYGR